MGIFCLTLPVQAELYVAGQIGMHKPNDASNPEFSVAGRTIGGSDLALQSSLMYGAKVGYYFDQVKLGNFNLGVETEVFNATPHFKQQVATIGGFTGTAEGVDNRVLTWAPVVALVRYQGELFEPYAGVGLGVFFSNLSDGTNSSSSTDVGLNTQVGTRYRVNQNLSLFTEWKYNYANISHTNILSYTYNAHTIVGGIGYHF
ncbi:MAG: outer membrane beta-barrel protein [Nitrospira sp.]|nr:outer membrane beta-barrel protein [Nitrospira sp.]